MRLHKKLRRHFGSYFISLFIYCGLKSLQLMLEHIFTKHFLLDIRLIYGCHVVQQALYIKQPCFVDFGKAYPMEGGNENYVGLAGD